MICIGCILALIAILIYVKLWKIYNHWPKRGIKQRKQIYLLGDTARVIFKRESMFEMMSNLYNAFPDERFFGAYQTTLPILIIKDIEIIKDIMVKSFDHFVDHRQTVSEGADPIWTKNLFGLKGKEWKKMRTMISPTFTSSKMKIIFNLLSECAEEYAKFFKKTTETTPVELKDLFTRYANDVIATVAFGVKCDSLYERDNEFYMMGYKATSFSVWRIAAFFANTIAPTICKTMGVKVFSANLTNFFKNLVSDNIKTREEQGIIRPDLISIMLEARKGKTKLSDDNPTIDAGFSVVPEITTDEVLEKSEITDDDITAQALMFFFGGFETVSSVLCFLGYELTINPDIQQRLQDEIDEVMKTCNGKLTYEALMKMKYMDMVVSETLRKWPASVGTDRICRETFSIEAKNPGDNPVILNIGDTVWIPTNAIHRDPKYYPSPNKFDPERFSDENKDKILPFTYLPFGAGPRHCVGLRFALMEMKTIVFHLLRNFDFVVIEKTEIPVTLAKGSFTMTAEGGIWIGLKPRSI